MLYRIYEIHEVTTWNKWVHEIEADTEADALAAAEGGPNA